MPAAWLWEAAGRGALLPGQVPGGEARRSRAAARRAAGLATSAVLFPSYVSSLMNSFPFYFSVTAFAVETPSRCGASAVFQLQRAPFRRSTDEHTRRPWRPRAERRGTQQPPRGGQRHRAALRRLLPPRHSGPGARLPPALLLPNGPSSPSPTAAL